MSVPKANFYGKFYLSKEFIHEVLTETKFNLQRYIVIEGKLMENDEYRLEEILNQADKLGYDLIQIFDQHGQDNAWIELIFKRK